MAPAMLKRRERKRGREGEKSRWAHEEGVHKTTITLFITPGVTEFTIKIPRSAALMDRHGPYIVLWQRWYFQVNPPSFLVSPRHLLLRLARRFPRIRNIIEFCRLCSQTRQIFWYAVAFYWSWKLYRSLQWDVEICVTVALIYSYQTSDDLLTSSNFDVYNFILWFIHLKSYI